MKNTLKIWQTPEGYKWEYSNGLTPNPVARVVATTEEGLVGVEFANGTRQALRLSTGGVIVQNYIKESNEE